MRARRCVVSGVERFDLEAELAERAPHGREMHGSALLGVGADAGVAAHMSDAAHQT